MNKILLILLAVFSVSSIYAVSVSGNTDSENTGTDTGTSTNMGTDTNTSTDTNTGTDTGTGTGSGH